MNHKPIIVTLALLATPAFAQSGPDFSPMAPRLQDRSILESSALPRDSAVVSAPSAALSPIEAQDRLLESYAASAPPLPADEGYLAQPAPDVVVVQRPLAPRQATIGNGLFNRRGPNDFGS